MCVCRYVLCFVIAYLTSCIFKVCMDSDSWDDARMDSKVDFEL